MLDRSKRVRPSAIRLDAATVCQLKCPTCPTASGEVGRGIGTGFLRFRDFKQIVHQNPTIAEIELSNWGEIFLNPELLPILRYAFRKSIVLAIDNGANLNNVREDVLEGLVKYRVRSMTCSIDGASQETYSLYRRGGNFNSVLNNIRKINEYKAKHRSEFPRLLWQFIAFGHNEHEINQARMMAKELSMDFYVKLSWQDLYETENFSPVRDRELVRTETGTGAADREEYQQKHGELYKMKTTCEQLWKAPQINFNGKVLGCCVNHWGDFGDALQEGLPSVMNSEKMQYARRMVLGQMPPRKDVPCSTCKIYGTMQRNGAWMKEAEMRLDPRRSRFANMRARVFDTLKSLVLKRKGT